MNGAWRKLEVKQDLRGFTEDKGWAHSNAHTADVFAQLLACEPEGKEFLKPILNGITYKICQGQGPWTAEEDERLVTAFGEAKGMQRFYISMNGKHFFRSLYFRGIHNHPRI